MGGEGWRNFGEGGVNVTTQILKNIRKVGVNLTLLKGRSNIVNCTSIQLLEHCDTLYVYR